MHWLSNISVKSKLLLLVSIFSMGLLGVSLTGWYSLNQAVGTSQALVKDEVKAVSTLGDVRAAIGNTRRYEKDLFLNLADEEALARYETSWKQQVQATRQDMAVLHLLLQVDEQAALQRMQVGINNYAAGVEKILVGIQRGEVNDPWRANQLMEPSKADIRMTDGALAEIAESVGKRVSGAVGALAELQRRAVQVMALVAMAMLAVSLVLGYIISRRIADPLRVAVQAIERIGQGDLSKRVGYAGRDETARVLEGIGRMQCSLASMVEDIRMGVTSMTAASTEIASGNADLSRRTESAAANLEETAASMDEVASSADQGYVAAGQARELVVSAAETARQGGLAIAHVIGTMQEINGSSRRISEIISVIDGIAFQTNILALNAAVESARAGEHGRGFAVVANEVRALAQRSADAAKDIKRLIGESVDRVESGSRLVADAGTTMTEIVESVQRVSGIIAAIANSAGEQNNGIQQVSGAIGRLDQITQQNAALVEQSAAAAESVRDQATRLQGRVAMFKVA